SNRQHTFPIDTANPRGFHPERFSNAGHPYGQAETSRHGPHQKIFIKPDTASSNEEKSHCPMDAQNKTHEG
ncbi:hypothetical protein, partial [Yoonia sp. R2-816]|uniref:hypothetical protein n=1 Tax=Yoonia sp. R2-816 TaxID=3342638 RepID=UPI00372A927C